MFFDIFDEDTLVVKKNFYSYDLLSSFLNLIKKFFFNIFNNFVYHLVFIYDD